MMKPVDCWPLLDQTFLSFRKNSKSIPKCFFDICVKNLLDFYKPSQIRDRHWHIEEDAFGRC